MAIIDVFKAHDVTLAYVADRMPPSKSGKPISQPGLSQIINGNPSYTNLQNIAKAMGMTTAQLIAEAEGDTTTGMLSSFVKYRGKVAEASTLKELETLCDDIRADQQKDGKQQEFKPDGNRWK